MIDASYPEVRAEREQVTREALAGLFADQQFDVLVARRLLGEGWDKRLAQVVFDLNLTTATEVGDLVAAQLPGDYNPAFMHNWITAGAEFAAVSINDSTRTALDDAADDDAKVSVFEALQLSAAGVYARSMVTSSANFGAHDAASAAGGETKTWEWSGKRNSRHAGLAGETVPIDDNFSNGMPFPGHYSGGADEVAGCGCCVAFNLRRKRCRTLSLLPRT